MAPFHKIITQWYEVHQRPLPWRETKDPYRIWLSEVILQQTRVAQGLPYYLAFVEKYPTVYDLAAADEEEVLKLWQGLGYYSRARNLHHAAQTVVNEYQGVFPKTYKGLLKLKGVGEYTAAAIASICYGEAVPVLDGNVYRVLSRFLGVEEPINSTAGKKIFKEKAEQLLDRQNPGIYNQAIMEFGALHCKPQNPLCETCPLQTSCVAYQQGRVQDFPIKLKKLKIKNRYFNFLVIHHPQGKTFIQKRTGKGIWRNLYQFPLIETKKEINNESLLRKEDEGIGFLTENMKVSALQTESIVHQLTHQKLFIKFWKIETKEIRSLEGFPKAKAINWDDIHSYPVPIVMENFLNALGI